MRTKSAVLWWNGLHNNHPLKGIDICHVPGSRLTSAEVELCGSFLHRDFIEPYCGSEWRWLSPICLELTPPYADFANNVLRGLANSWRHSLITLDNWAAFQVYSASQVSQIRVQTAGADPGFLPGEGAKGLMTLYGMGMSDFWHTQIQICNFSRCSLPYYAWMVLSNHSRDTSVPSFCPWDERTRDFGAGPSVPGVGARPGAPPPGSAPEQIDAIEGDRWRTRWCRYSLISEYLHHTHIHHHTLHNTHLNSHSGIVYNKL